MGGGGEGGRGQWLQMTGAFRLGLTMTPWISSQAVWSPTSLSAVDTDLVCFLSNNSELKLMIIMSKLILIENEWTIWTPVGQ